MRFSTDNPMQKTHYYKSVIPGFSLDEVFVGSYYDEDMQRRIHRFKFVHNRVDRVYFESLFAHLQKEFPPM